MHSHSWIESLKNSIGILSFDSRAEVLFALASDEGLNNTDLSICCDKYFHREYSKDIFSAEVKEDAFKRHFLEWHISRNGMYELLPEGLFFNGKERKENGSASVTELAEVHKQNQQREKEIRQFFAPFENELFRVRSQLKKIEIMLPEDLQSGHSNNFTQFWNIPDAFPNEFITPFIQVLPYAHQVAGNFCLTAQYLEHLVQETVQVREVARPAVPIQSGGLGNQLLDVEMICGEMFLEDDPTLKFTIGPLKNSQVQDYLEGGNRLALIETFYKFFLPAGLEVKTQIEVPALVHNMRLKEGSEPLLGYSTIL